MRIVDLKFNNSELVSTEYDPKTKKSGDSTAYSYWYSTDYIDISGDYALVYNLAGHRYIYSLSFFDGEKNFISGKNLLTTSRCAALNAVTVKPENAVYVRCVNFIAGSSSFKDPFLSTLPTKDDYDRYMLRHPRASFTVACLGDSLTEGDQGSDTHGASSMIYRNYPYYLAQTLGCTTLNYGKCGYTADSYFTCYVNKEANIRDADLILVMLGTNGGLSDPTLQSRYTHLLSRIEKDKKEGAVVVLITPPHATSTPGKASYGHGYPENALSAAEFLRQFAPQKGYLLIDAYADSPIQENTESLYQSNDGLHMNEKGYKAFAEFIAEKLFELGLV